MKFRVLLGLAALLLTLFATEQGSLAQIHSMHHPMGPSDCSEMEVWDVVTGMCAPFPMAGMPMKMLMVHGNAFGVYTTEEGPRGREAFSSPNMLMGDIGSSVGDRQYLNLNLMLTVERWTFPGVGYPELLQIGEENSQGQPFIDSQHPHSSPIMGIILSDTIHLGDERNYLKIFFAPRGQSTDGPVAFMHRPTGMVNPDAPLGHHIGQDVGHISSTVIGGSVKLSNTRVEASTFHGGEPEPTKVDLPLGTPDSYALRLIQDISAEFVVMASVAFVNQPEPHEPDIANEMRYSGSAYNEFHLSNDWMLHNAFIIGAITKYDHADVLYSLAEEFWLHQAKPNIWGRLELLQRTSQELGIANSDPNQGHWVTAITLGYTHRVAQVSGVHIGIGASITKDLLPEEFISSYGGNPWTGKVFLQIGGMSMWNLDI